MIFLFFKKKHLHSSNVYVIFVQVFTHMQYSFFSSVHFRCPSFYFPPHLFNSHIFFQVSIVFVPHVFKNNSSFYLHVFKTTHLFECMKYSSFFLSDLAESPSRSLYAMKVRIREYLTSKRPSAVMVDCGPRESGACPTRVTRCHPLRCHHR